MPADDSMACCRRREDYFITSVACSPDGDRIVSGAGNYAVSIWDVQSGECFESIVGCGDAGAIAAGELKYPLCAIVRGAECVVERAIDSQPIAWFPADLQMVVTHPSDRISAGYVGNHLFILTSERG